MIKEVRIKKVNQGFIINIGCQEFVSTDKQKMFDALSEYWKNPQEAERKYVEGYLESGIVSINKDVTIRATDSNNIPIERLGELGKMV